MVMIYNPMKTKIFLLAYALTSATLFEGCLSLKRGEGDPFLSLRSREARVVGDWKVRSIKRTFTNNNSSDSLDNYTIIYTMNVSTYTGVITYPNNPSSNYTYNGTRTWEWTFKEDGTYRYTDTYNGNINTLSGRWNFTSRVGDLKNKSTAISYKQSSPYTNSGSSTYAGNYFENYVDDAYDLKELRNKKMVWWYWKATDSGTNSSWSSEIEIEFEAK